MTNFNFLKENEDFEAFADSCCEAEKVLSASPAMCAVGCRKALEIAVKWVYTADTAMSEPYQDTLSARLYEPTFRKALASESLWQRVGMLMKLGNLAVHTRRTIRRTDALSSLMSLFEFVEWIDYSYGKNYVRRQFEESRIPTEIPSGLDEKKIRNHGALLELSEEKLDEAYEKVSVVRDGFSAARIANKKTRTFSADEISEYATRKMYIDVDLAMRGWEIGISVREEFEVWGMRGDPSQNGFVDYVLFDRDGMPLAVVEAKKTSHDPEKGKHQATLYADCLEAKYQRRPMIFYTNGFETHFWDDKSCPPTKVSGIFSQEDLKRLMDRRELASGISLNEVKIDTNISGRYYQMEAIRAVCDNFTKNIRKSLLVMATGTGKTRVAAGLVDVLSRGGCVKNVLFLADRKELVRQAKDETFLPLLPAMTRCNLLSNKDDVEARVVFSTYPTIMNIIDSECDDRLAVFSPAHFDLIIIDEAHRSIFKKYRTIFEYFHSAILGLTATPKTDIDRNTYDFFEMEDGNPTYAYSYKTAVEVDEYLVPYVNIETEMKFLHDGIEYHELSAEDKARYEEAFADEDGKIPDSMAPNRMNSFIFNKDTVDSVIQNLMEKGIKTKGGDVLGKTIVFAKNKRHAQFIVDRFNALYPQHHGNFAKRIVCEDDYSQELLIEFKKKETLRVAVSVDMMDTGIDVHEILNLVFFKEVRSKTKFWQMIGRGTRLCPEIDCFDTTDGEYLGKRRFYIFDCMGNFAFFREHEDGPGEKEPQTLSSMIFTRMTEMIYLFQNVKYASDKYQTWRTALVDAVRGMVNSLNTKLASVRLNLKYVEIYKSGARYLKLSEGQLNELAKRIAPLVVIEDTDEYAKRFDALMYALMLAFAGSKSEYPKLLEKLQFIASRLLRDCMSIPQVCKQADLLNSITSRKYWQIAELPAYEHVRTEIRSLYKFAVGDDKEDPVYICIKDTVVNETVGFAPLDDGYVTEPYTARVNRYINEHREDCHAIWKLFTNLPLAHDDIDQLQKIFTQELGTQEEYETAFRNEQFGIVVRKIAHLDHDAVAKAFADFINSGNLNTKQIAFINKIISHIEQNGIMEPATLMDKPFDHPVNFISLFPGQMNRRVIEIINSINANAVTVAE